MSYSETGKHYVWLSEFLKIVAERTCSFFPGEILLDIDFLASCEQLATLGITFEQEQEETIAIQLISRTDAPECIQDIEDKGGRILAATAEGTVSVQKRCSDGQILHLFPKSPQLIYWQKNLKGSILPVREKLNSRERQQWLKYINSPEEKIRELTEVAEELIKTHM